MVGDLAMSFYNETTMEKNGVDALGDIEMAKFIWAVNFFSSGWWSTLAGLAYR